MILDLVTVLLAVFGFYQGFSKGLIKTIFTTLSLLIGIVAALKLSPIVIGFLQRSFDLNPAISFVLGFVMTFMIVMLLIRFVGNQLEKISNKIHIGGINKLLGGILLGGFYSLLVSFGVYFMDKVQLISEDTKMASYTYPVLEPMPRAARGIGEKLRPVFSEFWDTMITTMDGIKEQSESIEPLRSEED